MALRHLLAMKLNSLSLAAALLAGGIGPALAGQFTFDTLNPGDPANFASAAGIHFEPAVFAPSLDAFGDPIPGTDHWRVDYSAPPVTVANPEVYGGGPAPSPLLALDAYLQPTLVVLPAPGSLADFRFVLDGGTFGSLLDVLFLNASGQVLLSLPVDQTQPYFAFASGPVADVASVLLPAGALYDNLAVPETNTSAAAALLILAGFQVSRCRARRA